MRGKHFKIKNKNKKMTNERKTIMKATRKLISLALAMLLVLALSITAFATPADGKGGTIKVEGAVLADPANYTVYTIYKMFDVDDGNSVDENKYKATTEWVEFVKQAELEPYFVVQETNDGTYMIWRKNTASTADAAAIAELAREYVTAKSLSNVGTVTVNGEALDVEDNGYYLLVPNNTTASGVIVVKNEQAKVITEKSVAPGMPTVEKMVYEDSLQAYVNENTADIGQKVTYKITVVAGQGASKYILHDKMDSHVEVDYDSVSITRGGNPVTEDEYEIKTDGICSDCTFHIVFDEDWCTGLNDGAVIVVTYEGKLLYEDENGEKIATDTAHENTAWLTHTTQNVETPKSTVATKTCEINVLKKDQDNVPLEGAGFKLRDNENRFYKFDDVTKTVSWVAEADATEVFSDAQGKLNFYGVDAEIFWLKETTVPGGYTGVGETQVNVKSGSITAANPVEVVNTLGQKLPETGGMGTTVFYVAGVVLVLGALATLVVIKRKESAAQ